MGGKGGGVCMYIINELKAKIIDTDITKHEGVDHICIQVQCRKLPSILICCIYRHPKASSTSFNFIEDTLRAMIMRKKVFFLLGDLNDNLLLPNSKLSRIITTNKLTQLIETPTRVTTTSATLLDVIITNTPDIVSNSYAIPGVIADHDLIGVSLNISKPKRQPIIKIKRDLSSYTSDALCSHILNETPKLNQILDTDDVNKQVSPLTSVITNNINQCALMSDVILRRPPAPWINNEVKEAIQERNRAQKLIKQDRQNVTLQQKFKEVKKRVKSLINSTKKKYYHQQLHNCKHDTAATWRTLRNIIPSNKQSKTNMAIGDMKNKVEDFNKYFANVGLNTFKSTQESLASDSTNPLTKASSPSPASLTSTPDNLSPFRPQPIDPATVVLTIKQLQNTNSFGSDGIPLKFIKDSPTVTIFYLTIIINTSIVTDIFPASWKNATVTPLHKKGIKMKSVTIALSLFFQYSQKY